VPRKPPKPSAIAVSLRDSSRPLGRHGSMLILEVRDERGRKALRYVHD
jgi:hypothetical protein